MKSIEELSERKKASIGQAKWEQKESCQKGGIIRTRKAGTADKLSESEVYSDTEIGRNFKAVRIPQVFGQKNDISRKVVKKEESLGQEKAEHITLFFDYE